MGYICRHSIIVTSWSKNGIEAAHEKAKEIFGHMVSELVEGDVNEEYSFFVAPDGSKEGWPESDAGDTRRNIFVDWLTSPSAHSLDWVEVQYGDDYGHTKIIRHSDEEVEE